MKIILTGATGFIGNHFLSQLLSDNRVKKILLIIRDINKLNSQYSKNKQSLLLRNKKIEILKNDLVNQQIPDLPKHDVLIHLADSIPYKEDVMNFSDNIKISENIINNIILKKVIRKVIYTSTLDVYGKIAYLPADEKHPTSPLTFYGISKLANELLIKKGSEIAKINCIILRLSQVYGPNEPLVKVIPLFIKKIKNNEEIIMRNNGNIIRDWVYIKDIISAIDKAIYSNHQGTFNIATGEGYSLKDLVKILGELIDKKPKIKTKYDNNDPRTKIILDIEKAKKQLSYHPNYSLEKGIRDYLEKIK